MDEQTPTSHTEAVEDRIVVGVDGSPCSIRALDCAAHQASQKGAVLLIVCVYAMPPADDTLVVPTGLLEEAAEVVVREALNRVGQTTPEVVAKGECVLGAPGPILVAASQGASGLVVGTRGHGHLFDLLLGSVSEHVVHHASCTTTVVR